jgi:carboxypeptidase Q
LLVGVELSSGDAGGLQYAEDGARDNTLLNHSIAIESDGGVFTPWGLGVSCKNESNGGCGLAIAQLETLSPLLAGVGGGGQVKSGGGGADIDPMCQESGVVCAGWEVLDPRLEPRPAASNNPCTIDANGAWSAPAYDPATQSSYNSGYFWFHHSEADTMERIDPMQLNENAAALAIWTFAIAELPEMLPRNNAAPLPASSSSDDEAQKVWEYTEVHITLIAVLVVLSALLLYVRHVRREKEAQEESGMGSDLLSKDLQA